MLSFEGYTKLQAGGLYQGGDIKRSMGLSKPTTQFKMNYCSFFLTKYRENYFSYHRLSGNSKILKALSIIICCPVAADQLLPT